MVDHAKRIVSRLVKSGQFIDEPKVEALSERKLPAKYRALHAKLCASNPIKAQEIWNMFARAPTLTKAEPKKQVKRGIMRRL